MFERIDIRLTHHLCPHQVSVDGEAPWTWSITQEMVDGIQAWGFIIACRFCDESIVVPPGRLTAGFLVDGKPAWDPEVKLKLKEKPKRVERRVRLTIRPPQGRDLPVTHERDFTPFDRRFLKAMKIKVD